MGFVTRRVGSKESWQPSGECAGRNRQVWAREEQWQESQLEGGSEHSRSGEEAHEVEPTGLLSRWDKMGEADLGEQQGTQKSLGRSSFRNRAEEKVPRKP